MEIKKVEKRLREIIDIKEDMDIRENKIEKISFSSGTGYHDDYIGSFGYPQETWHKHLDLLFYGQLVEWLVFKATKLKKVKKGNIISRLRDLWVDLNDACVDLKKKK